jgi:hypothetical protein
MRHPHINDMLHLPVPEHPTDESKSTLIRVSAVEITEIEDASTLIPGIHPNENSVGDLFMKYLSLNIITVGLGRALNFKVSSLEEPDQTQA